MGGQPLAGSLGGRELSRNPWLLKWSLAVMLLSMHVQPYLDVAIYDCQFTSQSSVHERLRSMPAHVIGYV
jgi:hypothetical protein